MSSTSCHVTFATLQHRHQAARLPFPGLRPKTHEYSFGKVIDFGV